MAGKATTKKAPKRCEAIVHGTHQCINPENHEGPHECQGGVQI